MTRRVLRTLTLAVGGTVLLALVATREAPATPPLPDAFPDLITQLLEGGCPRLSPLPSSTLAGLCASTAGIPGESTFGTTTAGNPAFNLDSTLYARLQRRRGAGADASGLSLLDGDAAEALGGRLGVFATYEYERYTKDVTTFEPGYDSNQHGGLFGLDYRFDALVLGMAFSVTKIRADFDRGGGRFAVDSLGPTLYASVFPMPELFLDVAVGYAAKDYEFNRSVELFEGAALLAAGNHQGVTSGNEYRFGANAGYDFIFGRFTVGPRLGLNYVYNTMKGYTENDVSRADLFNAAQTGLELIYDNQEWDSLTVSVGAYGSAAISTGVGVFLPQATVAYVHEFRDDQRQIFFRFAEDNAATRFRFRTDAPDRDYAVINAGLLWQVAGGLAPFLNYRAMVGYQDHASHTVTAGLRVQF